MLLLYKMWRICRNTRSTTKTIALGILSDENMRKMRKKCHHLFDSFWHTSKERNQCYQRLAMALDIDITFCHFGYFDQEQLEKAYQVMLAWKK